MIKKKIFIGIGAAIIVIGVIAIVAFLLATGNVENSVANVDLCGTWKVLNHAGTPVDNEYLVFDDTTVNDYRDGNTTPYIQSAYTVKGSELNLTDASKKFSIRTVSVNNLILTETDTTYEWKIIRCDGDGISLPELDQKIIEGTWKVTMQAGNVIENEEMIFENGTITDYRDNKSDAYLESPYSWSSERKLYVEKLGLVCTVFPVSEDLIIMVEDGTGYVWELERKS